MKISLIVLCLSFLLFLLFSCGNEIEKETNEDIPVINQVIEKELKGIVENTNIKVVLNEEEKENIINDNIFTGYFDKQKDLIKKRIELIKNKKALEEKDKTLYKALNTYGIQLDLKYIEDNKYELFGTNVGMEIGSIEILSCKENNSDKYDNIWYKLKTFNNGDKVFNYVVDKKFNNFCLIPYKIKLVSIGNIDKYIDIDLNLGFIDSMLKIKTYEKKITFNGINLNSFTILKKYETGGIAVDKNNLFIYHTGWPENYISIFDVENYLSYKISNGVLLGDNIEYNYGKQGISIDGETFINIKEGYFKDKNNYYQLRSSGELFLIGINKKNFEILSSRVYEYDNNFYYYEKILESVDKESFNIVNSEKKLTNGLLTVSVFAIDKNKLYFQGSDFGIFYMKSLNGDYNSFLVKNELEPIFATDNNYLFYLNENYDLLQYKLNNLNLDIDTLEKINKNEIKDDKGIYQLTIDGVKRK